MNIQVKESFNALADEHSFIREARGRSQEILLGLGIKSVFPCSLLADISNTVNSRCVLEHCSEDELEEGIDVRAVGKMFEDVVIRYRDNTSFKLEDGEFIKADQIIQLMILSLYRPKSITFMGRTGSIDSTCYLKPRNKSNSVHPGINSTFLFKLSNSGDKIFVGQEYSKHTALSISRFHAKTTLISPSLARGGGFGTKDLRLRFIIYQLLQALEFLHASGLVLDELNPSSILLDDNLWLQLPMSVSNRSISAIAASQKDSLLNVENESYLPLPRHVDYDVPLTTQWIERKISNFEYLMTVNHAAGRTMIDPLYHPIFPWVTDFTVEYPVVGSSFNDHSEMFPVKLGLRDLTKSKFRLSKGDAQLQTTYRHSDPPHHIPESLSELTLYIYLARKTPLQVLRRVVRDVFVPEHYPSSLVRMYEWTPDECIPELYTDPTVFESIHRGIGLADLEIPPFVATPEEFIAYHRRLLESDHVSRDLHRWLDITFGYCLEGEQAIANMNVPLKQTLSASERLGDNATEKHPGFCILFHHPHPERKLSNSNLKNLFQRSQSSKRSTSQRRKSPAPKAKSRDKPIDSKKINNRSSELLAFIDIDNKASNTKSKRKYEKKMNSIEAISSSTTNSTSSFSVPTALANLANNIANGGSSSRSFSYQPKVMSLNVAYDCQPSWLVLELAEDVDIRNDAMTKALREQNKRFVSNFLFSERYRAQLQPAYSLPKETIFQNIDTNDMSPVIKSVKEAAVELKNGSAWDSEFARSILSLQLKSNQAKEEIAALSSAHENRLLELINDDMFAVGCVIAELYLGKPLLSKIDALLLSYLSTGEYKDCRLATAKIMKIVYYSQATAIPASSINGVIDKYREPAQRNSLNDEDDESLENDKTLPNNNENPVVSSPIPFPICRLVSLLLQPDPALRPSAAEILQACTSFDIDMWSKRDVGALRTGGSKPGYVSFNLEENVGGHADAPEMVLLQSGRLDVMDMYCSSLFPSYFRFVYRLVGDLKLAVDGLERYQIILDALDDIAVLPLEGLGLALPHLVEVLSDVSPFKQQSDSSNAILLEYSSIIDVIGFRLGVAATEKIIIPKVSEFLNNLHSPSALQQLLSLPFLWHTLIIRGGVRGFLKFFLPLFLTYLSSATLQNISYGGSRSSKNKGFIPPLWATMGISDRSEWLHLCEKSELRAIQEMAVLALSSLIDPAGLGPGLTARFVLPPLMSLIGSPQFSAAGFNLQQQHSIETKDQWTRLTSIAKSVLLPTHQPMAYEDNIKAAKSAEDALEDYLMSYLSQNTQDTFTVHAVVALCSSLGEIPTSELVLNRICDEIIPSLEPLFTASIPAASTVSALMEIILLLNGILPNLSTDTISKYYLQTRSFTGSYSLPELLSVLPLSNMMSVVDDLASGNDVSNLEVYVDTERRYSLLYELVRLIGSVSMIVGSQACIEYVLPSVDKFFGNFVDSFGNLPIHSKVLLKAFELGAELYLPLENLTSGTFSAMVPNLNPKLEVWLTSIGSGSLTRTSPPLPSNILPETVVDTSTNGSQKKRGIFSGWMTSSSSASKSSFVYKPSTAVNMVKKPINDSSLPPQRPPLMKSASAVSIKQYNETTPVKSKDIVDVEYSPVAYSVMQAAAVQSTQKSLVKELSFRTPFNKLSSTQADTVEGKIIENSNHSATEGMELKQIDKISTGLIVRSLTFDDDSIKDVSSRPSRTPISATESDDESNSDTSSAVGRRYTELYRPSDKNSEDGFESARESPASDDQDFETPIRDPSENLPNTLKKNKLFHLSGKDISQVNISPEKVVPSSPTRKPGATPSKFLREMLSGKEDLKVIGHRPRGLSGTGLQNTSTKRKSILSKVQSNVPNFRKSNDLEFDEEELKDSIAEDSVWLLAGYGRTNSHSSADSGQSLKNQFSNGHIVSSSAKTKTPRHNINQTSIQTNAPSAQISMTSPRIAVDSANEAGSLFALTMTMQSSFRVDTQESSSGGPASAIRCLAINATESLLVTCSKSGTKLWSLNAHPITQVANYSSPAASSQSAFTASFLRSGSHLATCDGGINVWDIETSRVISYIGHSPLQSPYYSMVATSSRYGVAPGLQAMGDDQLLTSSNNFTLSHFDFRSSSRMNNLKTVSEWQLPSLPALPISQISAFGSSSLTSDASNNHLTCAISHEHYVFAGSNNGGLWVLDRRMGRTLASWQGHDSGVVKLAALDEHNFLSIAERSAFVWSYQGQTDPVKIFTFKNMPDGVAAFTSSTTIVAAFDQAYGNPSHSFIPSDIRLSQQLHVMYGIAGHKMYAARIRGGIDDSPNGSTAFAWTSTGSPAGMVANKERPSIVVGSHREAVDMEEVKLAQTYFTDRLSNKVTKQKLFTTSAVLLPLRRLLLLGAEDGTVRVVS